MICLVDDLRSEIKIDEQAGTAETGIDLDVRPLERNSRFRCHALQDETTALEIDNTLLHYKESGCELISSFHVWQSLTCNMI
jgi:hypothetical protein